MKLDGIFDLERIESLKPIKDSVNKGKKIAVFCPTENARCHIVAGLDKPALFITSDRISARKLETTLSGYLGDNKVALIAERDDCLINRHSAGLANLQERVKALVDIALGKKQVAIISVEGILQYYPKKETLQKLIFSIKKNDEFALEELALRFVDLGYFRVPFVEEQGCFSIRGDIVDIWVLGEELPHRIEFFDTIVESIRVFTPETMLSVKGVEKLDILPTTDILLPRSCTDAVSAKLFSVKRRAGQHLAEMIDDVSDRFSKNQNDPSLVWLLPFVKEEQSCIFDYFTDGVIVLNETNFIDSKLALFINGFKSRLNDFIESGDCSTEHKHAIFSKEELYERLKKHCLVGFSMITSTNPIYSPTEVFSIKSLALPKYHADHEMLFSDMNGAQMAGSTVVLYCLNEEGAFSLQSALLAHNITAKISPTAEKNAITIIVGKASRGFNYPTERLLLIGYEDMSRQVGSATSSLSATRRIFIVPKEGDYVVHNKHGIGISEGMKRVQTLHGEKDFFVIRYKDEDRLYLPAGMLDTVERYNGGETPVIHKLGGAEFEKVKKKVKEAIKKLTFDLVALYEKRLKLKGFKYPADTYGQKEMEDAFPFTPTADQVNAINDVKRDMEEGRIMDRLLCGDVGFGKTEVAIRAIFKTIMEGKQAAVLVPTTILAIQHYNTIAARLNEYKFNIVLLSRFVSQSQLKEQLESVKSGKTNIVVATHRLLSKDVVFNDLGLLVLDEEQRFGVEHKDKIKLLKNTVNILSLSATPIPRTLHMSLSGIRDISLLTTPPQNRLPVETYVTEYSDALLVDAVRKELSRDGQVFILYNRVNTIENFFHKVSDLLGDKVKAIYAHGQMKNNELEERIQKFYNREAQVMVSTTIIENGIDLPFANTLIVIDADKLGLSQLYQLRGRVGRSNVVAYAYFTVAEGKVLTANASKRLEALMNNTELGSGFSIAMQDMEIRGAGNVLGREQHGQMEKVGYDMYCKLVAESVAEVQGKAVVEKREILLNIDGDSVLPYDYITEQAARLKFYKRVSELSSIEAGKNFYKELTDVYSRPPKEVEEVIRIGIIKNTAQELGIKEINIGDRGCSIIFYDEKCLQNQKLMATLSRYSKYAVLSPTRPPIIVFMHKKLSQKDRIRLVLNFLSDAV